LARVRILAKGLWEKLATDDLDRSESGHLGEKPETKIFRISKRSRLERYIDMLKVVNEFGPIRRTHILYKANLSWGDLDDSLRRLEETGALQKIVSKAGIYYQITDVGKQFLSNFVSVKESLELGQSIENPKPRRPV